MNAQINDFPHGLEGSIIRQHFLHIHYNFSENFVGIKKIKNIWRVLILIINSEHYIKIQCS